ncbi:MAG: beta-galactosidase trimerization domain-containing protein [Clostridia bacterium]|nr:beta-galactosidase trimerization domain-containing protein [Clostridia bacterium]
MRYRQLQLEFQMDEKYEHLAKNFTKEKFRQALIDCHADHINLMAKCHHGWSYFPTEVGGMHPNLDFDLLKEELEVAHELGLKAPVYVSCGLDERISQMHHDWHARTKDGEVQGGTLDKRYSHVLCINSDYFDFYLAHVEEICTKYDVDGLFADIISVRPCYCDNCRRGMAEMGLDVENESDVVAYAESVYVRCAKKLRETLDKCRPGLSLFLNGGHVRRGRGDLAKLNTHLELESLPTGKWGYDHFPLSASYARTLGMDVAGMTAMYHLSWSDVGGYKHPDAMRYEVFLSAACGAGSSIGCGMGGNGVIDNATCKLIGKAYAELEKAEPWLKDSKHLADVGVFGAEISQNYYGTSRTFSISQGGENKGDCDAGCVRMLLEGHYLFDSVDADSDLSKYKVIILPDEIRLDERLEKKFNDYVADGGKILASGRSGLCHGEDKFALDFGVEYAGAPKYPEDYILPDFEIRDFENAAFVMYAGGTRIKENGGEIMAKRLNPCFKNEWIHFGSQGHAGPDYNDAEPGIAKGNAGIYIGWNIFEEYATSGSTIAKRIVCHLLDELLGDNKTISTNLPAQGVVAVADQNDRRIVHLLYAAPVKRGNGVQVIEDVLPIYGTDVTLEVDKEISKVTLVPQGEDIPFEQIGNHINFLVPKFTCHQLVCVE